MPERQFVQAFRGTANQQAMAILLKVLPHLGYFPRALQQVPAQVRRFIAEQLGHTQDESRRYAWHSRTRERHWVKIRSFTGWRAATRHDKQELEAWLRDEGGCSAPTSEKLIELPSQRLRHLRIELPAEPQMRRLVGAALNGYFQDLYKHIVKGLTRAGRQRLDTLTVIPEGTSVSPFEQFKLMPGKPGLKTLDTARQTLQALRQLQVPHEIFTGIPWRILVVLKRRALHESVSHMRAHPAWIRHAVLATFVHVRTAEVIDDLLTTIVETVQKLDRSTDRQFARALVADATRLAWKVDLLSHIAEVAIAHPDATIRDVLFPLVGREHFTELAEERHHRGPQAQVIRHEVIYRKFVRHYRRMLPMMLDTLSFESGTLAQPIVEALAAIRETATQRGRFFKDQVPLQGVVTREWRDHVLEEINGQSKVHRRYYELCVLHKLQRALKCKEVWVTGSHAYRNPSDDLPADWTNPGHRLAHYHKLGKPLEAQHFIDHLSSRLTAALQRFNDQMPQLQHVRIHVPDSRHPLRGVFALDKLPRQQEPSNLRAIKDGIHRRYGMLELLDVLVEADRLTDLSRYFTQSGTKEVRSRNRLRPLLLLALFAEGTNLGVKRVVNVSGQYGYEEVLYARKRYLSTDGLRNANTAVINKLLALRNPRLWGEGQTCASDGKRFESWSQNLMTEWRTRYRGEGVLAYWHVETNAVCLYSQLKSFSSSEVAAMLEGLIRHDTDMRVEKNFVDSHGQSEVAFAFCSLLGTVRLMPRLKRIKYERLYVPGKMNVDTWPNLRSVLARPVRWDLIAAQYDEMIRATVALKDGTASAEAILKRYNSYNRSHPAYRALAEVGKVEKTIFLCEYLASRPLQYEINDGLQVVENWNATNHFICYGQRGELTTNSREEQELRVLSLQLLQNCLMLINTILVERTIERQKLWRRLTREDFRGITPLFYSHINPYGTFDLDLSRPSFFDAA